MAKKKGKQTTKSNPKKVHEKTAGQKAAARVRASAPPAGTDDEGADESPQAATAPIASNEATGAPTGEPDANEAAPAAAAKPDRAPTEHDPRIPPVGTVIIKKDRQGGERVRCTIVEGGVECAGTIYKSLSGAGLQASKD